MSKGWPAQCPECGWTGDSLLCEGGEQIADTGDYDDALCPVCFEQGKRVPVEEEDEVEHECEF